MLLLLLVGISRLLLLVGELLIAGLLGIDPLRTREIVATFILRGFARTSQAAQGRARVGASAGSGAGSPAARGRTLLPECPRSPAAVNRAMRQSTRLPLGRASEASQPGAGRDAASFPGAESASAGGGTSPEFAPRAPRRGTRAQIAGQLFPGFAGTSVRDVAGAAAAANSVLAAHGTSAVHRPAGPSRTRGQGTGHIFLQ